MKKATDSTKRRRGTEMKADYSDDIRRYGARGKYAGMFPRNGVVVVLDPDVARVFRSGRSVEAALRLLAATSKRRNGAGKHK